MSELKSSGVRIPKYKHALMDAVHAALVHSLQIAEWDRFQRLYEIDSELFDRSGKTDMFTMIEITLFPGRTKEQKAGLYHEIVRELHTRLHIPETDIFIVLNEPPNENWGLAGKQRV